MKYDVCNYFSEINKEMTKNMNPPKREAYLFDYYIKNIPIMLDENDIIAGKYGFSDNTDIPEYSYDKSYYKDIPNNEKTLDESLYQNYKISINFSFAHTCLDYGTIVSKGLKYYIEKVENELNKHPDSEMLVAMKSELLSVISYAKRYSDYAFAKVGNNKNLKKIGNALLNVPLNPAKNMFEALQSIWIMHSLIPVSENAWYSISIGRIDQFLYDIYCNDIKNGVSREEIKEYFKAFFVLLDSYGDGACALNIGGMDLQGNDLMNELSLLLIEVEKEMRLRAPIFATRINSKTPQEIIDNLIDFDLFKIGQPTFYGEIPCRKAVAGRNIKEEDAACFSANSCMGLMISGSEFSDMWGIMFNALAPLELAINNGKAFNHKLNDNFQTKPKSITNINELLEQFETYFSELIEKSAKVYTAKALSVGKNKPNPLLSALLNGCIENMGDRAYCAKYNIVTVETLGLINAIDSIEAIDELVFKKKKYTIDELILAAKNNFENFEDILKDLQECEKYGENGENVNNICEQINKIIENSFKNVNNGHFIFVPSLHTLDNNVSYGKNIYASLDGRKNFEPVNKNANPSLLLKKQVHTNTILSAVKINQLLFSGGQPIDLYFDKSWFETKELRDKIKALILSYFSLNGLQIQVNSIDLDILKKAHKNPEQYPNVIIRRGGYSVRFNELGYDERQNFIDMAENFLKLQE